MALYSFEERSRDGGWSVRSVPESLRGPVNVPRRGAWGNISARERHHKDQTVAEIGGVADDKYAQGVHAAHTKSAGTGQHEPIKCLRTGCEYLNKHSLGAREHAQRVGEVYEATRQGYRADGYAPQRVSFSPSATGHTNNDTVHQVPTDKVRGYRLPPQNAGGGGGSFYAESGDDGGRGRASPPGYHGRDGSPERRVFRYGRTLHEPDGFDPQQVPVLDLQAAPLQYGEGRDSYLANIACLPPEMDPSVNPRVPRSGPGSPMPFFHPAKPPAHPVYVLDGDPAAPREPTGHYDAFDLGYASPAAAAAPPPDGAAAFDEFSQGSLYDEHLPADHPLAAHEAAMRVPGGAPAPRTRPAKHSAYWTQVGHERRERRKGTTVGRSEGRGSSIGASPAKQASRAF